MSELIIQQHVNPGSSAPLQLVIRLECNTDAEHLAENVRINAAKDLPWLKFSERHNGIAVIVGGGPSAVDHLPEITALAASGASVFALNNASRWLTSNLVPVRWQMMIDARRENIEFLDDRAGRYLLASQCHPDLVDAAGICPTLIHLASPGIEDNFPADRLDAGDYALVGGGFGVGNSAICAAWVMGFRLTHCFGFDSSHRDGKSHAYPQPMNDEIPTVETEWAGRRYVSSLPMRAHAERFQLLAHDIQAAAGKIIVHGDGLLPAMFNTPAADLPEREKYRLLWQFDSYRQMAPGEGHVAQFLELAKPPKGARVIDFGCGTGRGSIELARNGYVPIMVDFAGNCLDREAADNGWQFIEHDLTVPLSQHADFGFCTDVMEHIPMDQVDAVIRNVMASADVCYFNISTVDDAFGKMIGARLHNTVRPAEWWAAKFNALGFDISYIGADGGSAVFLVKNRKPHRAARLTN